MTLTAADYEAQFGKVLRVYPVGDSPQWTADIMPLDATDPDSLVGQLLGVTVKPTSNPDQIRSSEEELPLWRVMDIARFREDLDDDSDDATICAAEIEAVRDWIKLRLPHLIGEQPFRIICNALTAEAKTARSGE